MPFHHRLAQFELRKAPGTSEVHFSNFLVFTRIARSCRLVSADSRSGLLGYHLLLYGIARLNFTALSWYCTKIASVCWLRQFKTRFEPFEWTKWKRTGWTSDWSQKLVLPSRQRLLPIPSNQIPIQSICSRIELSLLVSCRGFSKAGLFLLQLWEARISENLGSSRLLNLRHLSWPKSILKVRAYHQWMPALPLLDRPLLFRIWI